MFGLLNPTLTMDVIPTRRTRDPKFRDRVLTAYEWSCAVCGFDVRMGSVSIALDAAHIHWHTHGGPDEESNGLALCVLHHKTFDLGAFTVKDGKMIVLSELWEKGPKGPGAVLDAYVTGNMPANDVTKRIEAWYDNDTGTKLQETTSYFTPPGPDDRFSHIDWSVTRVFDDDGRRDRTIVEYFDANQDLASSTILTYDRSSGQLASQDITTYDGRITYGTNSTAFTSWVSSSIYDFLSSGPTNSEPRVVQTEHTTYSSDGGILSQTTTPYDQSTNRPVQLGTIP